MTRDQKYRADQILGFVNRTLKFMPNTVTPNEMQAQYLIQAAMVNESDQVVIDHCNLKFKTWYNCKG